MIETVAASVLAQSLESVSIYALDSTVLFMNAATERMMGVTAAAILGKRLFELYPDAIGNAFHTAFVGARDTGQPHTFEHYYPPFDGWFASRVIRDGEHIIVYARDVTEEFRNRRRLATFSRISDLVTRRDLPMAATAQGVVDILGDVLDADCSVALLTPDGAFLEAVARHASDPKAAALFASIARWPATAGNTVQALERRETLLATVNRITSENAPNVVASLAEYGPSSVIIAPLLDADRPIGTVTASRAAGRPELTHHDQTLLAEVAPTIALYIANARRRVETELLQTRLTTIADALPALVAFVDTEERYQYVNATYAAWFGEPRERYVGHTLREVLGDAYVDLADYVRRALAGERVQFRQKVSYPNGTRVIAAHYAPVVRPDGTIAGFAALVNDVTHEARVSEIERAATARLESLLSVTGRLAGVQLPGDVTRELVDGGARALASVSAAMWERRPSGLRVVRHHGSNGALGLQDAVARSLSSMRAVWEESAAVLPLGSDMCLTFVFDREHALTGDERTYLEILASHGAEAMRRANAMLELHDASELQAAVIDASPTAVLLLDAKGIVRSWNPAAERIFGFSASQAIGHRPKILGGADAELDRNLATVIGQQKVLRFETRRQQANGNFVDVEIHAAPVRRSSGEMLCLAVVLDITERKSTEHARQQMIDEAQRARAEAEAANRSKDEFLAILGHELRNPLAPMVTALELMRMRADQTTERERAVIGRQVQHLSRLVDDLLDVSRITRGKIELRRERLPLVDVVMKAVEQTSPLFEERRHHLEVDVPVDLELSGDPTRLAQVIANLLANAAKYTPRSGTIALRGRQVGETLELTVRDNGIGIPASILPHVFDLFVQAPQSSERPAGGLGLGLTIVKSLVELHGGTVSARSDGPGRGSEFIVSLPAHRVASEVSATHRIKRGSTGPSRRILVVDDNEDAALMLADVLDAYGHEARTAFDGPSALRIAGEFVPDVAVLDIGLPVMDGYELAERLRSDPDLASVRLIAVTGYGQESDRQRSLEAGFQAHLAKPVEIEALVSLVEGR